MQFNTAVSMLVSLFAGNAFAAPPLVLAALESTQCSEVPVVGVRPLFYRAGDAWQPVDEALTTTLAGGADWTIALDGKSFGVLQTTGLFVDTQVLQPAPGATLPKVGNSKQRFAGWCETPVRRPLAASSNATFSDPDQWKPFSAEQEQVVALLEAFRSQVGTTVPTCSGETEKVVQWAYQAEHLQAAGAYQDRNGRQLLGVVIDASKNSCDGPPEQGWHSHWFVIIDAPRFVGTNLDLVEAVDFDQDGASELLLWRTDYNEDGYVLLDGSLKTQSKKLWSYH